MHPFLLNLNYAWNDRQYAYLCTDYLSGGDLRYHLEKSSKPFDEKQT